MDLIGSLLLEWNTCPPRPDLHVAHTGAGDPVGTPVVTKDLIFVSLSFSRKAEGWDVQFIVDLTSLLSLKGVSEDKSLQEIT